MDENQSQLVTFTIWVLPGKQTNEIQVTKFLVNFQVLEIENFDWDALKRDAFEVAICAENLLLESSLKKLQIVWTDCPE